MKGRKAIKLKRNLQTAFEQPPGGESPSIDEDLADDEAPVPATNPSSEDESEVLYFDSNFDKLN